MKYAAQGGWRAPPGAGEVSTHTAQPHPKQPASFNSLQLTHSRPRSAVPFTFSLMMYAWDWSTAPLFQPRAGCCGGGAAAKRAWAGAAATPHDRSSIASSKLGSDIELQCRPHAAQLRPAPVRRGSSSPQARSPASRGSLRRRLGIVGRCAAARDPQAGRRQAPAAGPVTTKWH